jgi:hypothetical protein
MPHKLLRNIHITPTVQTLCVLGEKLILAFLKLSKWSIEKAKKKIDAFYTIWCRLPSLLHLETLNPTSQIQMTFADIKYFL